MGGAASGDTCGMRNAMRGRSAGAILVLGGPAVRGAAGSSALPSRLFFLTVIKVRIGARLETNSRTRKWRATFLYLIKMGVG